MAAFYVICRLCLKLFNLVFGLFSCTVNVMSLNHPQKSKRATHTRAAEAQYTNCDMSYYLKVPKREIFDRPDSPDFYTIKSSWVGDLLVKILTYYFNF